MRAYIQLMRLLQQREPSDYKLGYMNISRKVFIAICRLNTKEYLAQVIKRLKNVNFDLFF